MKKMSAVLCRIGIAAAMAIPMVMAATLSLPAIAQDNYPSSPVKMVVGYPPGATIDIISRLLAEKLTAQTGASFIVENKAGASGNIGSVFVAKSKPDGYTVLFNLAAVTLARAFEENTGFDLFNDFSPVALVASAPSLVVVHPSVPVNNIAELMTHLRANPGKLAYPSAGAASTSNFKTLLFLQPNGLSALHVPYKGTAAAAADLIAGRLQFAFTDMGTGLPLIKDGRVRALVITSLKRSPALPDLPAVAETIPGFETVNWFGVLAPAKTPRAVIVKLNSEILKALKDPDMGARLQSNAMLPLGSTPEEYGAYMRNETEAWKKIIKATGIKAE